MRKWKKALFIFPYQKTHNFSYEDLFPPLGLEYIATAVKDLIEELTIIDMRYEKKPLSEFLAGVEVVGISITWPHQREVALGLIEHLPESLTVILGGIHATENVDEYLEASPRIDIIVRGDGEEIIRDVFSGKELSQIRGISYRQGERIIHNKSRVLPRIMDFYPDRSLRRYHYRHKTIFGLSFGIDTMMGSRGCPYDCEFCTHKLNPRGQSRGWSGRSAESVVEEIKRIEAKTIVFTDDNLVVNVKLMEEICDLLIARGIRKVLAAELRLEIVRRPEILEKMRRAGFRLLAFGIESAQDKTLKRIRKGFTVQEVIEAFRALRKYKMLYGGFFIFGYIGEDEKDMLEMAPFARSLGMDLFIPSSLRALKYSPLIKTLENTPGYHIDETGVVFSEDYSVQQVNRILNKALRDFYRPLQILKTAKKIFLSDAMTCLQFLKASIFLLIGGLERLFRRRLLNLE
jgi:anaerobic magnesium-protoporphyrin IX monomethyl ester cyclase